MSIFEDLCSTLHILGPVKYSRFLLLGDFNVDFCNEDCYLFSYITGIYLIPVFLNTNCSIIIILIDILYL